MQRADRAGQTLVCATSQSTVSRLFIRGGETPVQTDGTGTFPLRSFLELRKEGETENDTCGKKQEEDAFNETLGETPAFPVVVRS